MAADDPARALRWLLDTDAAWRSARTDLRAAALLLLPDRLDREPAPAVIKPVFLKLSEYWRSCSNDMRVVLATVIRQCARHIAVIPDAAEIMRRILIVVGSNDPCARSLSLMVLGYIAQAARDRTDIHYRIFKELDSPTQREVAAAVHAVDNIWPFRRGTALLRSLQIMSDAIKLAERFDDQGNIALRLVHVLRNSDKDFHLATHAAQLCASLAAATPPKPLPAPGTPKTLPAPAPAEPARPDPGAASQSDDDMDLDEPSASVAPLPAESTTTAPVPAAPTLPAALPDSRAVAIERTLMMLAHKFPAMIPARISATLTALADPATDPALRIAMLQNMAAIAAAHPHFFQPLDISALMALLSKNPPPASPPARLPAWLARERVLTARILRLLSNDDVLFRVALASHRLADEIVAYLARAMPAAGVTADEAPVVLNMARVTSAALAVCTTSDLKSLLAGPGTLLMNRLVLKALPALADNAVAFGQTVSAAWALAEAIGQSERSWIVKTLVNNRQALRALVRLWSQSPGKFDLAPLAWAREKAFNTLLSGGHDPKTMIEYMRCLLSAADASQADLLSLVNTFNQKLSAQWIKHDDCIWYALRMIEEQLVAGLADAFYARIDLTVYEVDSPVVLAWLRTIECLRAMSLGAVRLKHIGIDKQKWLKAARWGELDEALVHLRLSATLGMPRPFQTRFVELLRDLTSAAVAVWTRWRNCRPRGSGVYEDSVGTPHPSMRARFERLARAFDELPECFFGMDAESEDITAYYAIVCRALADMCDRDSGMPYFAIHLARRVTKHVEQNPGVCNARQLVGIRDFALSMPSRFDDSLLPPLFAYRPIPRFFFRSTKPVQFKVEISPLPKPGHALVLRRRMMLVVRFEGSLSFSEADAPKWRDGAAVRFDVSILGPDGVEIMATSTTCTTQPPAGYFSTSCTISTDTLTPRFQVSVRMSLTTPPAMLAPGVAARSWRLGHAESFSVRLLEADAPL